MTTTTPRRAHRLLAEFVWRVYDRKGAILALSQLSYGMRALFDAIGYAENMEEDTRKALGFLGADVANEVQRRWQLFDGAVRALSERADKAAVLVTQMAAK